MLTKIIPDHMMSIMAYRLDLDRLYEIRLRVGRPVCLNYNGRFCFLGAKGISDNSTNALVTDQKTINDIIARATDYSLYAHTKQLNEGFLTVVGGIRIGIAGEVVYANQEIKTIKNFNSLCIRVPHSVPNCAFNAFRFIFDIEPRNTLIISPPGCGKTTFIRDIACLFGEQAAITNVLVVDERSEIGAVYGGVAQLAVGKCTDIISNSTKEFAFRQGIRAMRPDVIITDEIASIADIEAIEYALTSGVKVIATVHARDHLDVVGKPHFDRVIRKRLFSRFVTLSNVRGPGTIEGVFDENMNAVYYP